MILLFLSTSFYIMDCTCSWVRVGVSGDPGAWGEGVPDNPTRLPLLHGCRCPWWVGVIVHGSDVAQTEDKDQASKARRGQPEEEFLLRREARHRHTRKQ